MDNKLSERGSQGGEPRGRAAEPDALDSREMQLAAEDTLSFEEVSLPYVRFLRIIGLLPFEARGHEFLGSRLLLLYFFLSSLVNWSMFVCFCVNAKEVHVDAISETVLTLGVSARFYMMILKRRRLEALLRECASLWSRCSREGRERVRSYERKLRKLFQLFVVSCCFINVLYPLNALLGRAEGAEGDGGAERRRVLPYRWYGDDTEERWPGYWPVFCIQLLVVQNAIVVGMTCDAASPLLMILGAGYFRHLRDQLLRPAGDRHQLARCCRFHQRVLGYCGRLERFARTMLLTQLLSTGYNISLILLKLVGPDRDKYKYLSILSVYVCQLFLVQWSPDYLFDESLAVSTAAYFASVHWMRRRLGKHLLTIVTRAQRPVQITAGGFVNLSLQSFGSMLTSAFTFFTMLRNLNL